MKKMSFRYCADRLLQDVLWPDVYCSKQPAAVAPKETITIISSFLELGRRKLSMQPNCEKAAGTLLKQKPSKHS